MFRGYGKIVHVPLETGVHLQIAKATTGLETSDGDDDLPTHLPD